MTNASVEIKRTYCKICMTACGLVAEVQGDQILRVRGDKDHPLFEGYTCPKGRATGQLHHRDDAITRPLMRKDGELVEVEWDEALDDVAAKLRKVLDTYGPDYVGIYFGSGLGLDSSGYTMEDAFYKYLGTPPKFSPLTNDSSYEAMLTSAVGRGLSPKVDYHNTMMVLYVGINPMISHADNNGMWDPATWLRSITKRGGEIWTIDPLFTATANLSTRHIAAYPGKDYAILAWIVKEIIDNGPLKPKQPVQGLDELRAALEGYNRATAAEVAGVAEQEIQDLLDAIRRAGVVSTETGTGIGMSPGANLTAWFCWLIMILTGSTNEKGGAWFHPGFFYPLEINGPYVPKQTFYPGSRTRPDIKAIIGPRGRPGLAVRDTRTRDRGGQHPRLLQLRWHHHPVVPRRQRTHTSAADPRAQRRHRDPPQRRRAALDPRPTDQGLRRAPRDHPLGLTRMERVDAIQPAARPTDG